VADALVATGLVIKKGSTGQSWQITDCNWSGYSLEVLDGSHMGSTGWREKVLGTLADPGELSVTIHLTDTAPPLIDGSFDTWSAEYNGGLILSGAASVTAVEISASVEQIQTAQITLTFDGAITLA